MKSVKNSSRIRKIAAAVLAIAATVVIIYLCLPRMLVLRNGETGRLYAAYPLQEGETFSVTFIHSVNKSPVTEVYERRGRKLVVTTCIYSSLGAGMETEVEPGQSYTVNEQGQWVLTGIDREVDPLLYFVGTVSDHVMEYRGEEISLRELCGRSSQVRFRLEKRIFADQWIR